MLFAITGASGFVARKLVASLIAADHKVRLISGSGFDSQFFDPSVYYIGDYMDLDFLCKALSGCDVIFHLAARAHLRVDDFCQRESREFYKANFSASENVFLAADRTGVKRVVYVSSIGVLGESTNGSAFDDNSPYAPVTLYAHSKAAAEHLLFSGCYRFEWVILRPPLVYGSSPPGNLRNLLRVLRFFPCLPFGKIRSRKSYITLQSLVQCLILSASASGLSGRAFAVSDPGFVTLSTIVKVYLRYRSFPDFFLVPIPLWLLRFAFEFLGRSKVWNKLNSELLVDSSRFQRLSGWKSSVVVEQAVLELFDQV